VPVPLDCTASLLLLPGLPLAAEIQCPGCARHVTVRGPPPEGFKDPWQGSAENRISPHWSRAMPEGEPRN
jgi:hypothetical protein